MAPYEDRQNYTVVIDTLILIIITKRRVMLFDFTTRQHFLGHFMLNVCMVHRVSSNSQRVDLFELFHTKNFVWCAW